MFLDGFATPKEIYYGNRHEYNCTLHGIMLLTSAEEELFLPPTWNGTIYSTRKILDLYHKRFCPDVLRVTYHPLEPFEPELICCEQCVTEISVLPLGSNLNNSSEIAAFLLAGSNGKHTLITKEVNELLAIMPIDNAYYDGILSDGIDIMWINDHTFADGELYHKLNLVSLIGQLRPRVVKGLFVQDVVKMPEIPNNSSPSPSVTPPMIEPEVSITTDADMEIADEASAVVENEPIETPPAPVIANDELGPTIWNVQCRRLPKILKRN